MTSAAQNLLLHAPILFMNFLRDAGDGIFHIGSSLTTGWTFDLVANRFARLRQLYFSKFGTVAHSSPKRFEIAAKSGTGRMYR